MQTPMLTDDGTTPYSILVVEDNAQLAHLLANALQADGFAAEVAYTGEAALEYALREVPHLVLLDLMLPGIDGFEVVRRLRANVKTAHIPVVILSARHDIDDKVRAFESRVDDYLTKPYDDTELLARIKTQLRRVQENMLSPLTGLPGGAQVERAIAQKLREAVPWSILYLDLDHFKAYNDVYGFVLGNDLIRLLATITGEVARDRGNLTDFVGHIGGDDFVLITTPDRTEALCQALIERFDRESRHLFSEDDLRRGTLIALDRQGNNHAWPLVSLSIAVVTNQLRPVTSIEQVSRTAAELKRKAKATPGSIYVIDRRRSDSEDLGNNHLTLRGAPADRDHPLVH
ncbi:MAG TPA: response regulator [Ktedonobacterales bacterium]|nr:response regulator [Ktedonobacterales bacterium]